MISENEKYIIDLIKKYPKWGKEFLRLNTHYKQFFKEN